MDDQSEYDKSENEQALAEFYHAGLDAEKAGKIDLAIQAYLNCLKLDSNDPGGAALRLASLGYDIKPERASSAYVATLFNQHAEVFDTILVDQLGYNVPGLIRARLVETQYQGPFGRMLDLGCGTGLVGEALEQWCDVLVAVDLAQDMIVQASERGCYDDLYIAEAVDFLLHTEETAFDLIVAADVFPYLGDLQPFFHGLKPALADNGIFAFSTEIVSDQMANGNDYKVGGHQRFAHHPQYIDRCLSMGELAVFHREIITVRSEQGAPVYGELILARKVSCMP